MKIVQLKAENFKRLQAIEINPDGNLVTIGGDNGQGKSSILDAIWVALAGRAVAPPKPIRVGEETALIELDLGRLKITRKFTDKDGKITDTVKVESAEGLLYRKPQEVLDALVGEIGFDPLEFARMKPAEQADELRQMVPLSIDLDEHIELDASDFAKRRDVNRDAEALRAQIAGIPIISDLPEKPTDTGALLTEIANAGKTNAEIDQEEMRRRNMDSNLAGFGPRMESIDEQIAALQRSRSELDQQRATLAAEIKKLPALAERVDIDKTREALDLAERQNAQIARMAQRTELETQLAAKERTKALAEAEMPIEGLSFGVDDRGKPIVLYAGVPFEQSSDADKIKASTAIAMAANPELRVLRIKDGSLLDAKSLAIIADMAKSQDFQLWMEIVGEGDGVGFIMENGLIRQPDAKPKAEEKPAKADKQGDLLA